ncbi:hypothetical protein B0T24DRAFT_250729 [Lasiosphaeria ovina]|uniref:Uncharacterized protein n=1 Tax=Lasiosphaeria ovina TaxID=92902 RepID=A0AAE0KBQ0_9PEZI|nr:hypothetical protein B0T24DRAFT_250729 [Lasiosphaeria ovina]
MVTAEPPPERRPRRHHSHSTKEVVPQPDSAGLQALWPTAHYYYPVTPPQQLSGAATTIDKPPSSRRPLLLRSRGRTQPQGRRLCCCVLRTSRLWLLVTLAAALVILVALSVGLAVGMGRTSTDTSTHAPAAGNICPSANGTVVQTTSTISLSANNTTTTTTTSYRIFCDAGFGGDGQGKLASVALAAFAECATLCGSMNALQNRDDVGCAWDAAATGNGTCSCLAGADEAAVVAGREGGIAAVPLPLPLGAV